MSRSNTHYYNICNGPFDGGFCDRHKGSRWLGPQRKCIQARAYFGRRGMVRRVSRMPEWSWKGFCAGPPRSMKRIFSRRVRALYRRQMRCEDPVLFDGDKFLIGLYGRWA